MQYFLDQIKLNYEFSNQQLDFAKLDVFALDDSLIFTLLAGVPGNTLAGFYSDFSLLFSSDLSISVLNNTISLKQFFSRSCNDDLLLLDKVKMHYNIQLFSKLDPDLIQEMANTTKKHLSLFLKDPKITDYIKTQMNQINELQLKPRIDLLTLLNETFLKH